MNPFFAQNIAASRTFQIDGVRYLSRAIINKDRSEKYFKIFNTPSFAYFEQHNIDRLQQLLTTCEDAALSPFWIHFEQNNSTIGLSRKQL